MSGSQWNTKRAESLWLEGRSGGEIAEAVGAPSRSAVIGHMARRGLHRSQRDSANPGARRSVWTPELEQEAKTRWLDGDTAEQVAEALGGVVNARAVTNRLRAMGVKRPVQRQPKVRAVPDPVSRTGRISVAPIAPSMNLVRVADAPAPADAGLKTLGERGPRDCCWPIGAPDMRRGQLYCGRPVAGARSYCADHSPHLARTLRDDVLRDRTVQAVRRRPAEDDIADLTELLA